MSEMFIRKCLHNLFFLKSGKCLAVLIFVFCLLSNPAAAADSIPSSSSYSGLVLGIFVTIILLALYMIISLADKIIEIARIKAGVETKEAKKYLFSLFPTWKEMKSNTHKLAGDAEIISLRKGMDLRIEGRVKGEKINSYQPNQYALKPTDFVGMSPIPKVVPEIGQRIKAGETLFFDKKRPDVKYAAPFSGTLTEIRRGAKRKIEAVVIDADKVNEFKFWTVQDPLDMRREAVIERMLDAGVWTHIKERPYGRVANETAIPKAIHISAFHTEPLAPNFDLIVEGQEAVFQAGINALSRLTEGKVHLNLSAIHSKNKKLINADRVQINWFDGVHPAGLVGVQIHHIDPIKKGDIVWTVKAQDVLTIGTLFTQGCYVPKRVVSIAGPLVLNPQYISTTLGANMADVLEDNIKGPFSKARLISGDLLTGKAIGKDGFLGFLDHTITAIPEGDYREFLGWLIPQKLRPSASPTIPLLPLTSAEIDTNTHGEKRAFVVTGQYESVLPMDIYLVHLLKAILANDFEQMEGLGIYELLEEDVALCEFVCVSKQPVQAILRNGLDYMIEQA